MRAALLLLLLSVSCGGDPQPVARLLVDLRLPRNGLANDILSYNVVAKGPFADQCDAFAFQGASLHESGFRGTLGNDVTIEVEGLDTGGSIVVACGASAKLDLGGGGEISVPIYLGRADRAEAVDPPLDRPRSGHRVAALADGRVLVVGGSSTVSASLLIDMASGETKTLDGPRAVRGHTLTALPDGSALLLGGADAAGRVLAEAWRFDPSSSTFEQLSFDLGGGRRDHTGTLLCTAGRCNLSGRVLVVGGSDAGGNPTSSAWILDPLSGDATPLDHPFAISEHAALELENGDVLIAGGTEASIFVPDDGEFRRPDPTPGASAQLSVARRAFTMARAPSGAALILGGQTSVIEAFDPAQDGFTIVPATPPGSSLSRGTPSVVPLPDGRLLVAGGGQPTLQLLTEQEDANPLAVLIADARGAHSASDGVAATLLYDGSVLLSGGTGSGEQSIFRPCPRTRTLCR